MVKARSVVKRTLFSWVSSSSILLQISLILIAVVLVSVRVFPLEMQKRIVNEAIILKKFDLLFLYCAGYLLAVSMASGLKYLSIIIQTNISQRTMADMRNNLYSHIIRLPLEFFRKTQPGLVVNSLVAELNVPSQFVGMAIAVPFINILTLLAFAGYLFYLNPLLAVISFSIYPVIIFLVPILQKRANEANKKRVDLSRQLSGRIAESISGIHEIHGSGAYKIENNKFASLVRKLQKIRVTWTRFREGVKVTNNFFTSLGPLIIFILGGYLAINGRLDLGALVAFLSAQEKLYTPWKELIEFYQVYQNATVTYSRTMKYFDAEGAFEIEPEGRTPFELTGKVEVKNLSFITEDGIPLLSDINFSLQPGEHLALIGFSGSGKSTLAKCIGQLYPYTTGQVLVDDRELSTLTKLDVVHNIGFIPQEPFIFEGTVEENLLYACDAAHGNENTNNSCNSELDDMVRLLQQTASFVDILRFGLGTILDRNKDQNLAERIIKVRRTFQSSFEKDLEGYIEFFNEDNYLYHLGIGENLVFGTPQKQTNASENLLDNQIFRDFLYKADLTRPLLKLGAELTEQTLDILGNLTPNPALYDKSPIDPDELDSFKELAKRLKSSKLHQLNEEDQNQLLVLALRFTPGKHKMAALPTMLENLILEGRALFKDTIADEEVKGNFTSYNQGKYIFSQPIINNIFFGKITTTAIHAQEKINKCIVHLLIEEDLLDPVIEYGLQYEVGSKGENLSGGQKQKLAIARALLKDPKILIMDEATSALDNKSQTRIQNLLETRMKGKTTVISVIHRLDIIKNYDKVAVMKAGKIVEFGPYKELMSKQGVLYELVSGKK